MAETTSSPTSASTAVRPSRPSRAPSPVGRRVRRAAVAIPVLLVCAFLVLPLLVVAISSFADRNSFAFPPSGVSLRWYGVVFSSDAWLAALASSGRLLLVVVPIVVVLGVLGGYAVGAGRFPGRQALAVVFLSPIMVPGVMLGLALLHQMQGLGLVGSNAGLVLAHLVVTLPFAIRVIAVSAAALDPRLVRAAQALGASPWRAFLTVTVPLLRPGIVAAGFLAAVISLGEVAVSVFVAGARSATAPVLIYSAVQVQLEPTIAAISTLMLLAAVVVIAVLDRTVRISRFV
ncbi:ABC transporter permease [Litorihabitans aurantiacus]|uniref:ABC transporter permease n=1 Tax=Litorihabitans aurantiacus TaxID=1930061 RepID=A0AA37XH47_9MICO|nr:ABC transporter permease [Litorihabitans aurantiacus]GMA33165.1 ABC transporter permease [Litorihabitans aurantiacus]